MAEMAGGEAEMVTFGDVVGDRNDRRYIEYWRRSLQVGLSDDATWERTKPRMRRACRRLLRHHWAAVERVAAALVERGALTGRQIDALVRA